MKDYMFCVYNIISLLMYCMLGCMVVKVHVTCKKLMRTSVLNRSVCGPPHYGEL